VGDSLPGVVSEREVPTLTKIDPAFASVHCWHVVFSAANTGDFTHTHVVSDQLEDLVVQDKKQNSEDRTTDRRGFGNNKTVMSLAMPGNDAQLQCLQAESRSNLIYGT
jgi:hypothetical protein